MVKRILCLLLMLPSLLAPALAEPGKGSNEPAAVARSGFVTVKGRDLIAPDGQKLMLRGMSIGNWLVPEGYMFRFEHAVSPRLIHDAFSELVGPDEAREFWRKWTATFVSQDDFTYLKKIGCNSVRIPFSAKAFVPEDHPEIWLDEGFVPLDNAIKWAKAANLYVVLDMHVAPGGQTGDNIDDSWGNAWLFESPESQARMAAIWKKIAARYKDETTVLGYELLNEPIAHFLDTRRYNPLLEKVYRQSTAAIREVDRNHVIILGGAQWDSNFDVFGPPFDPQLLYTFHRYWCSTEDKEVKPFADYRSKYNVPIWLGESGENTDKWIADFRVMLDRNDIGWCFWPYKKLDSSSCIATYKRPPYWHEIIRYADTTRGGSFADKRKARPPLRHAREALEGLLENVALSRCKVNETYVRALGLQP